MLRLALTTLGIALAACGSAGAMPVTEPSAGVCFGAAARDPRHDPCRHPKPTRAVYPVPRDAQIAPAAPCLPIGQADLVTDCAFGRLDATATGTVALVGDSHAAAWRAALEVVAQAQGWRGLSITRDGCALSLALRNTAEPARSQCLTWSREVVAWFKRHPEIATVFVSSLATNKRVLVPPGGDRFAAEARGYHRVWKALPRTVKHIVVLRDVPRVHDTTLACVRRAMRRHGWPGPACSVSRRHGLVADAAAAAARAWPTRRVQLVNMTPFFCGRHRCLPVVGGALVYKDGHHLTTVFSTTLGPFVLRRVRALAAAW